MSEAIGRGGVTNEELALLHDGELSGAEAQELLSQVDSDPAARAELEGMQVMQRLVTASLQRRAEEVPQARFEQVWDEIERTVAREHPAGDEPLAGKTSLGSRLRAMLRPLRFPAVAAAAAVLAVWWATPPTDPELGTNEANLTASVDRVTTGADEPAEHAPEHAPEHADAPTADSAPRIAIRGPQAEAQAEAVPGPSFTEPKLSPAEINEVEFAGSMGRIGRVGTVTMIYVEDSEPPENERSL